MEKYIEYYNENVTEDIEHITTICEIAGKQLQEKFKLNFVDDKGKIEPKIVASTFSKIFDAVIGMLVKLEKKEYSDFQINVCGRLLIGYSTNENEDDEKCGNFMIFIKHLSKFTNSEEFESSLGAKERSVQWNAENIVEQSDIIKQIAIDAIELLNTIEIKIATSECIMPIFITVYESIVNYIKIKRREIDEFEFEVNFCNCFFVGARENEEGTDDIYFRPNIESKLTLKDDNGASAKYE